MKIGDTVYIVCSDTRYQSETGTKKVIKVGNTYFEVEGCPWEKFLIKGQEADYSNKGKGQEINMAVTSIGILHRRPMRRLLE